MENSLKKQIVEAIKAQLAQKNLTQNGWAQENYSRTGVSAPHMSNVMNEEKWDKVSENTWQTLANLLLPQRGWIIHPTHNQRTFLGACNDAKNNKRFIAISAYTGAGKTTALTYYAETSPNTWYLVLRANFSRRDLVQRIAEVMGIRITGNRTLDYEDAIIQKMCSEKNALLILDSSSKLEKDSTMRFIGDLAEAIEHKAGLVIAGTEFLKSDIERGLRLNKRGYAELNRRIYVWLNSPLGSHQDGKTAVPAFMSKETRAEVLEIIKSNGITEQAYITKILEDSKDFGTLRSAIERMKNAKK